MELLLKKTIKILSFSEQYSLEVSQILPQLQPLIKCVSQEKFIQKLKENHNIKVDDSKKDKILISLNKEQAKEANDEKQLNLFFKEDKTNKSLYYLYRLILQAGVGGINYSDLAKQFNMKYVRDKSSESKSVQDNGEKSGTKSNKKNTKKNGQENKDGEDYEKDIKKLDITNVSHYCRKLFTLKFINILPEKVCKKAVATKFQDKYLQIDTKMKRKQTMASEIDLEDSKKQQFTKLSIVSEPWRYLKEDTFIINELTFTQNILLNFASYEAFLREGLLQTEIASKINKLGERKMLVRSLENIIEDYKVQSTADRQGRTFSLKFHIKSQVMADYIDYLLKENKINVKKELEDMQRQQPTSQLGNASAEQLEAQQRNGGVGGKQIQTRLQFTQSQNNEQKEARHLEIKIEEKPQNGSNQQKLGNKSIEESNKQIQQDSNDKSSDLQSVTKRQELFNQNPKLNYSSFEHIYKYFQDNDKLVQDLIQVSDKEFILKCMKVPPPYNDNDYQRFSELLLKIINETVEFTYVRTKKGPDGSVLNEQSSNNNNKRISKKQISRNKLNRYIHILNRIEEKKVIKTLKLKKYIIALEKNQGVGEIDKKTLEHILNTFSYINYISVKKIKIDIQTISQNIVRSIIIHKDIPEDDPRVVKAEKTINKGLLKKGPKQEESDDTDFDSDSEFPNNSSFQNQQQQKQQNKLQITKNNGQQGKVAIGKQSDITNFLIKKQRVLQPNQKIYYYDEEEIENQESNPVKQEQLGLKIEQSQSQSFNPSRKTSMQIQLQEALSKVTKENCEIPARPAKMKLLSTIIFQFMERKLKKNYQDCFNKINEINYSTIYTTLYFQKDQVEFKYPLFQQNLCNNLLQLSQSHKKYPDLMELEIDNLDLNTLNVPSVDQLLNDALASTSISEEEISEMSDVRIQHKEVQEEDVKEMVDQNNQNNSNIEQLKMALGILKGKEIKNQKTLIQDSIMKFKSYLLRHPCRKLVDTKMRYQMVDYFSFLNQCVYNDSIKFFKLNKESNCYEKVKLSSINIENIDSIFYQITSNYYNHFNLSSSPSSSSTKEPIIQ